MYDIPYHDKDISNTSFLVTGGAGFVGSNIVEYLVKYKAGKVRVLDNLLTGKKANIQHFIDSGAIEFIEGDITDFETCLRACEGIDKVCHQAALGSVPRSIDKPLHTNAINVEGTLNVFNAAKENGIKRVVYASSSSVYGDHKGLPKVEERIGKQMSPYAVSKYSNELYAHVFGDIYGQEMIGLRYFNIFGPNQAPDGPYAAVIPLFIDKIIKQETVYIDGDGEQTRDFTFVENAVQANIRGLMTENEEAVNKVFNIAVGQNFSVNYLYNKINEILGASHPATHREARTGDIRNSLADISKASNLLGYKPTYKFEDGLQLTVEYFTAKLKDQPA